MTTKRHTWVTIGITALVLLNIGLVATFWLQRSAARPPALAGAADTVRPGPALLIRDLNFDSVQAQRFTALRNEHFSAMQGYRAQMRDLKDRFYAGLREEAPLPDSLATAIGTLQAQMDRITYQHFRQVRALCTHEQKERFDRIIGNVIRQLGRPGPRRGPGPGGEDRPFGPPPGDGPPDGPMDGPPPPDER
ncbi:hypothetical protein [Flaviaesturariibacter amylovorans]|uniref:Periplasmic heavy metal sensor n=1 Tax=Flaviaesturariibacter amylovorans TaxID=1084520 RepID=A0ABP8HFV7_9BACT